MTDPIRIGIVGAGDNTKRKHLPGFRNIDGVEIAGVVNRTPESTNAVAAEFEIPKQYATWQELVADDEIDAVLIGTWPNLHCEITCAALKAGKHVLSEARMARDLAEADQMLAASKEYPELVAQVVPSPFGLKCGPMMNALINDHFLGDLREIVVLGANDLFWDYSKPIHWRQDSELSGKHILSLGILYETLVRWAPEAVRVFAQTELFEPNRPDPENSLFQDVSVPDSVQIVTEHKGGARGMFHISGVILFGPGLQIHLYGSRGTIKIEFNGDEERILSGRAGDSELKEVSIPEEEQGAWTVEEDFIAAIRGEKKVELNDFATAMKYMEFIEAVDSSAAQNAPVDVPGK